MATKPNIIAKRAKSLKIKVSEQEMVKFAKTCAEYTAYMLDIHTHQEMPSLDTLNLAALPYKLFIAQKLSNALAESILPNMIRHATFKTVMIGGYFSLSCSVRQTTGKGKNEVITLRGFNISFVDETGLPLVRKLSQVLLAKDPSLSPEQLMTMTEHLF